MAKFRKLSAQELSEEHFSVLRELGRAIGVKSPTSKNKEELIADILAIQNGDLKPREAGQHGAPVKMQKADLSRFYEPILPNEDSPVEEKEGVDTDDEKLANEERAAKEATAYNAQRNKRMTFRDVESADSFVSEGVLEQCGAGYGFLRANNYENSDSDVYVSLLNIKKYNLRRGDKVKCVARKVRENDLPALQDVIAINDLDPQLFLRRKNFDDLLPYYPTEKIRLETKDGANDVSLRLIDLFAPLGMGQRGLIVAPPKTGKTTLLKKIAQSIEKNHPEIKLIVLLIDERPEEVTDIKRSVSGEVVFSTFDENAEHHVRAAELVINRAKRLVEVGQNVVILMDSITRLARAYNNTIESSGKTLSGGLDPVAMYGPKRFFGAARNIENGGSLTVLSTALVDTGSRMDDYIYEEFKGTGNMEIHLSRELSEKRVFPAIDLYKSGTRKEELLLSGKELSTVYKLRKILSERADATDSLIEMMKKTATNEEFIVKMDAWIKLYKQ